jgi:hypothetical protein
MWREREKLNKNVDQLRIAYDELIKKIKRVDPVTLAETTDGHYRSEGIPQITLQFLHSWFVLDFLPYKITGAHELVDTLPLKVLALQHFLAAAENQSNGVHVMGKWIDCRDLQHGAVLGAHFSRKILDRLRRFFSMEDSEKISRALRWAGKPAKLADEGFEFKLFPRLPVALINWKDDEEFPAYSKILFDVSASNYMPTHGLAALTEFLIFRLTEEQG